MVSNGKISRGLRLYCEKRSLNFGLGGRTKISKHLLRHNTALSMIVLPKVCLFIYFCAQRFG